MNETWKPIPGYEDKYELSTLGRVRSMPRTVTYDVFNAHYGRDFTAARTIEGKLLKGRLHKGSQGFTLHKDSKSKMYTIDQLRALGAE